MVTINTYWHDAHYYSIRAGLSLHSYMALDNVVGLDNESMPVHHLTEDVPVIFRAFHILLQTNDIHGMRALVERLVT